MTGKQIQEIVNEILGNANREDFLGSAINWGDLRCRGVTKIIDMLDDDIDVIEVLIEEADPNCNTSFEIWVAAEFKKRTGQAIYVRCEW